MKFEYENFGKEFLKWLSEKTKEELVKDFKKYERESKMEDKEEFEEEFEVGEYYRTRSGEIYKITDLDDYGFLCDKFYYQIVKHSKNIIDLIEVGDYVNGRLVLQVDYKNKNICLLIPLTDTKANTNIMWYGYEDIKSIVTHEMFESVGYKVEKDKYNLIKFDLMKEVE